MPIFKHGVFMSPKGRYSGHTPDRVRELLIDAVSKSSQAKVAEASGLTRQTVQRYMQGIGEPSTRILQKLADYFGVTVAWLRGEENLENMKWRVGLSNGVKNIAIVLHGGDSTQYYLDSETIMAFGMRFVQIVGLYDGSSMSRKYVLSAIDEAKKEIYQHAREHPQEGQTTAGEDHKQAPDRG